MCFVLQVRFKAAQAHPLTQQRLEDSRSIGAVHKDRSCQQSIHNLVSATRSRFETQQVATVDPVHLIRIFSIDFSDPLRDFSGFFHDRLGLGSTIKEFSGMGWIHTGINSYVKDPEGFV